MQPTQPKTKSEARNQAIQWQVWQATQALSYSEILGWHDHFKTVARQFNLTAEFKENGII